MSIRHTSAYVGRTLCALACTLLVCLACLTPAPAHAKDAAAFLAESDLAEGTYQIALALDGGSGRASVTSPARLEVAEGTAWLTVEWSSPHYDYMIVAGERYTPINEEGNSVFRIPALAFDEPFEVIADTTAMSEPHEIDYQLTLDSATLERNEAGGVSTSTIIVFVAIFASVAGGWLALRKRR